MTKLIVGILVGVLKNEDVQTFLIKAAKEIVEGVVTNRILPAIPIAIAGALDAAIKQIPGIDNIKDVAAVAQAGRETLDQVIPDFDIGFKPLDDLLDAWRPKN